MFGGDSNAWMNAEEAQLRREMGPESGELRISKEHGVWEQSEALLLSPRPEP